MVSEPKIAIVVATFNGAGTLEAALDSIAAQSVAPDQLIIIDGGSTDGTQAILKRRSAMISYWESAPDKNLSDAWNKALPLVTADWIWFIGCDDRLADCRVVERWRSRLAVLDSQVGLVYARAAMTTSAGRVAEVIGRPWPRTCRKMRYFMSIPHTAMLSRRNLFECVGPFDDRYALAGDYEWTRRALSRCEVRFFDDLTVAMGDSGLSGSSRTQRLLVEEFGHIVSAYGPRPLAWWWLFGKAVVKERVGAAVGRKALGYLVDFYRILTLRRPRMTAR